MLPRTVSTNKAALFINPFVWLAVVTWAFATYAIGRGPHPALVWMQIGKFGMLMSTYAIGYRRRRRARQSIGLSHSHVDAADESLLRVMTAYDIGISLVSAIGDMLLAMVVCFH